MVIPRVLLIKPCSETGKHYLVTDEKEIHYWCIMCAKELNMDGSPKERPPIDNAPILQDCFEEDTEYIHFHEPCNRCFHRTEELSKAPCLGCIHYVK